MNHILICIPFQEKHKQYIEAIGQGCVFEYSGHDAATLEQVQRADIIFGNVSPKLIAQATHLKWLHLNSAGADPYLKPGIIKPDTLLTCSIGAYGLSVSELMVTLSLMLCRKMDLYMRNQVNSYWNEEGSVTSIWNSTTLVIGLGDLGREYAKRMKALGSYVIGIRKNISEKPDYVDEIHSMEELDELLPRADFVTLLLPSTAQTKHVMDERRIGLMKQGAFLLNGGRGDAVDCAALNQALRNGGQLGGAALDVTDPEPLPEDNPLWNAPRCIITPHVAGKFHLQETVERVIQIAGENLKYFLTGDTIHMNNRVDLVTGEVYGKKVRE